MRIADIYAGCPVFLTGHTGFKGAWLSLWLAEMGAQVTGYSLSVPTEPAAFDLMHLSNSLTDGRGEIADALASKRRQAATVRFGNARRPARATSERGRKEAVP